MRASVLFYIIDAVLYSNSHLWHLHEHMMGARAFGKALKGLGKWLHGSVDRKLHGKEPWLETGKEPCTAIGDTIQAVADCKTVCGNARSSKTSLVALPRWCVYIQ